MSLQQRDFGRTGLHLGALGFGCGAVGALMVRGTAAEQERAVARAIAAGVNYFDTAPSYGDGESERTIGRVLRTLRANVVLGTKVRLADTERGRIGPAIAAAMDASLQRLGRDSVDLFQLHNPITAATAGSTLSVAEVLEQVIPAFERLRDQGKTRFLGITAIGDAQALHSVVASGRIDAAQVPLNLLNPSPIAALPAGFPAHDFDQLMPRAKQAGVGVIGIRVLAAGALTAEATRHAIAMPQVDPIGSAATYATDLAHAHMLLPLVSEGHATSLLEAAMRYAISNDSMGSVLVGFSSEAHLEQAIAALEKGPLPAATLARVAELQAAIARGLGGIAS